MTREELKDFVEINDTSFFYNGNEYYIFLLNNGYNVGEYNKEEGLVFKNFDDMIENWNIKDKPLKKLLDKIKLNY